MSKTKTRFGFKSKSQLPLFMIWREWLDNDGEVYDGKVLFTTSHINGKAVVLSLIATVLSITIPTAILFSIIAGLIWLCYNIWVLPIIGFVVFCIAVIGVALYGIWEAFTFFYKEFDK